MKRILHPTLILTLLTCFLFVSSALTVQVTQHSTHHATHHQTTTHANPVCSWMCAAGQVLQTIDFELREPPLTSLTFDVSIPLSVERFFPRYSQSRAPPSSLLS
ncbi:MAG: hypothetical protein NPIRA05_02450 [Nitrospirales bacterium]|nr:MAG: hypothetical protein NPIRA05_02450 [Nitrospirales bacterium]